MAGIEAPRPGAPPYACIRAIDARGSVRRRCAGSCGRGKTPAVRARLTGLRRLRDRAGRFKRARANRDSGAGGRRRTVSERAPRCDERGERAATPAASAARSISGKSFCCVSCQTRISSCAKFCPEVPVCSSSSGSAWRSMAGENRNDGSNVVASRPGMAPGSVPAGAVSTLPSRNQSTGLPKTPAIIESTVRDGVRLPVSSMLR